jgi:hypothetical protein
MRELAGPSHTHLDEGVNLADGRDVVGDEGLEARLDVDGVRLEAADVLEEVAQLWRHGGVERAEVVRVVELHLAGALAT